MAKHTSYRGQSIDMDMMKYQNQNDRALGNANMNARGDKLGAGGTVIKTREELLAERERQMQLPDYLPEHNSHEANIKVDQQSSFDDSMFEMPEQDPVPQPSPTVQPVQEQEVEADKAAPRRVRAKKEDE